MIKVRLQGTKRDLRWMLKGISRDPRYEVSHISEFRKNDESGKYHRVYVNLIRKDKRKPA